MSKIICFEKWDYDCGTLNQMSFEFDNSITIDQISKLADRILNDYYDGSETNDEIELDEVYIYNKCYEFCKEQGLIFNTIKPDITVSLDTQKIHIKDGIDYLFIKENDGWYSIVDISDGGYRTVIQAQTLKAAEGYISMIERVDVPFTVL